MNVKLKADFIALILMTALFVIKPDVSAQQAKPSPSPPSPSSSETIAKNEKSETQKTATPVTPAPTPAATPEPDFWNQEELTGDWGGTRSRWKEKGFEMEFSLTQFFQGTAAGGIRRESEYNGKFKTKFKFDFGKLAGWKYWSADIGTETRFGGPPLGGIGTINPVNTSAIIPAAAGTVFAVGTVSLTRLFPIDLKKGDLIAVSVGRFNLLDLSDEDFFGGGGTERFMNIAQIGPLTVLRQVPLVTNGASFAYIRRGEPFITFALLDTNDHSVDPGLDNLFADGVTFSPGIHFPTKWFGKSGKHSFGFAVTTKEYTPFDSIRQVIIPGPPLFPIEPKGGSWSVNYTGRQYIVERGKKDGWGFFVQVSFADKATSPITTFLSTGIGGNGLFKSRRRDEFGISYAYTGLSDDLKDNLDLLQIGGRPRAEHQVEMFYNLHITPWLRLTGDLQIIRPTRATAETAIVPGVRLELVF
ncbi:MAG TPA: carbohydrate porin [Pyrinomonadaceae bacterium]|jgi:porin